MSLDKNLFTLNFTQNADDPTVTDLVDASGVVHYHKQRVSGAEYKMNVYDPISGALLASAIAPSATSKNKTLELYNPTIAIDLKYTGTLSFRWTFSWEEHEFEWRREECYIIRKPDPPVLVAVTKEPPGRIKTSAMQFLDYNINRFDINDRKGLEIAILTALLTFQDTSDDIHTPTAMPGSADASSAPSGGAVGGLLPNPLKRLGRAASAGAPVVPPKPPPKTGAERVAELHVIRGDAVNEVTVEEEVGVDGWADYCVNLLQDDAMLFITIRSAAAEQVPKVLQVVEETKRKRYKAGTDEEQQLHQYVVYDTPAQRKGPRVIKLDDPASGPDNYAPPQSLAVHLSKIAMPELQPNVLPRQPTQRQPRRTSDGASGPSRPPPERPPTSRPLSMFLSGSSSEKGGGKKAKEDSKKFKDGKDGKKLQKVGGAPSSSPPSTVNHSRISSYNPEYVSSPHPGPPLSPHHPPPSPWAGTSPAFPMPSIPGPPPVPRTGPRPYGGGPPAPRPTTMFSRAPSPPRSGAHRPQPPSGPPGQWQARPPAPQDQKEPTLANKLFGRFL